MTKQEAEQAIERKYDQFQNMIKKGKELGVERKTLAKISTIFRWEIKILQDQFPGEFPSAW